MRLEYQNNRKFRVVALSVYMVLILWVSLKPVVSTGEASPVKETLHNVCHVPAYSVLIFLIIGVFMVYDVKSGLFVKAFIFSMLYGILMEFLQGFVPGRTPSLGDVILNAAGALIMIFLIKKGLVRRFLNSSK